MSIIFVLLLGFSECYSYFLNSDQSNGRESGWEHVFAYNISSVIPLNHYGSKSYYLGIQVKATYIQSMQFCESIHMKLLTLRSSEENDIIQKYIRETGKGSEDFWTSGSKLLDGRNWMWMSHGDGVQYTNWAPDEPNDDLSQCLHLSTKNGRLYWYDCWCDSRQFFICERSRVSEGTVFAETETIASATEVIPKPPDWMQILSSASPSIGLLQYKDKRYFLSKSLKTTYLTAIQFCKIINMDLVTIASEEENNRIYKYIRDINGGPNWWTSGSKLLDGKSWIWLTKGSHVEYTNWLAGQPDADDEFCLQLVHQKDQGLFWQDSRCSEAHHIICETTCSDDKNYCGDGGVNNIGYNNARESRSFVTTPKSVITTSPAPSPVDEGELMNEEEWQITIRKTPPGFISFVYVEGLKYHMEVDNVATKSQAEIFCDYHQMKLVSILREDHNDRLKHLMIDSSVPGPFWTSSQKIDGVWTWPMKYHRPSYSNWASGRPSPDSSDKNCLVINLFGEWLDESCLNRRHFICEIPSPTIDIRLSTDDQEIPPRGQCSSEPIVNVYISNNVITADGENEVSRRFLSSKDVEYRDTGYHVHVKNTIETPGSEKNNEIL